MKNKLYQYWRDRKIDWKTAYWDTFNHPHRNLLIRELARFAPFRTIYELGMGAGANLYRISQAYPNAEYGGMDINQDAVDCAKKMLPNAHMAECNTYELIPFSDKSVDVLFTDAALIYCKPNKIKKVISEMKRVARVGLLFCEADSEIWWERLALRYARNDAYLGSKPPADIFGKIKKRLTMGYNAYDYDKLLTEAGCWSIKKTKIPHEVWPDGLWDRFGNIITCRV